MPENDTATSWIDTLARLIHHYFLGILLALPVASALNVLVNYMHKKYRESSLYLKETEAEGDG